MDRAFKGIWIPAEIWLDDKLTVMEKVLYAEIDSFCSKGRECFCSNAHFAKVLQVSERQVRRLLCSLEEKGVISRRLVYKEGSKEVDKRYLKAIPPEPFDTTPADIDVPTPTDMYVHTPPDNIVPTPGEENVRDTNTNNTIEEEEADWQAVLKCYQNNIHPIFGSIDMEKLSSLYKDFGKDWVMSAIEECVKNNVRNLNYLSRILERWERDGYKVDNRRSKSNEAPRELSFEEQVAQMEAARQKRMALEEEYLRRMEEAERNGKSAGNGEYTSGERTA
jgi:DnaD/phage-associated family protein